MKKSVLFMGAAAGLGIVMAILFLMGWFQIAAALLALCFAAILVLAARQYSMMRSLNATSMRRIEFRMKELDQRLQRIESKAQQSRASSRTTGFTSTARTTIEEIVDRGVKQRVDRAADRVIQAGGIRDQHMIALHDAMREQLDDLESALQQSAARRAEEPGWERRDRAASTHDGRGSL